MAAAFTALSDQRGGTQPGHQLCHGNGCHHGNDLDTGLFPVLHILGRISGTGGNDLHFFFHNHTGNFICERTHQHDVHADGFVGKGSGNMDLLPDIGTRGVSRRDNTKAAAITYGSGQFTVSDPSHASLKYGVLNTQFFTNC